MKNEAYIEALENSNVHLTNELQRVYLENMLINKKYSKTETSFLMDEKDKQLNDIKSSYSWKLTYPLRMVAKFIFKWE